MEFKGCTASYEGCHATVDVLYEAENAQGFQVRLTNFTGFVILLLIVFSIVL
jgi:hypothetical protein